MRPSLGLEVLQIKNKNMWYTAEFYLGKNIIASIDVEAETDQDAEVAAAMKIKVKTKKAYGH